MKIIFSNYDDVHNPYYAGGGARSIHEIAKRLAQNHSVTVLTGKYPGSKDIRRDGVYYKRIGPHNLGPFVGQLVFQLLLNFYIRRLRFDVWVENFTPPFSTGLLQLSTKKPVIGMTQLLAAENMSQKYHLPFEFVERLGLKTYRYFITPTASLKEKILKSNSYCTVDVIPNGVTPLSVKSRSKASKPYVLFLGRIDIVQKGLDLLIESFNGLQKDIAIDLVIAGSGLDRDVKKLNALVHMYGLEDRIHVVGHADGTKKDDLLRNCLFVVMPSRFEGFGIVALEAFSAQKPIVTFDIDDLSWIPDDVKIKAKAFSVRSLTTAITELTTNTALRQKKIQSIGTLIKRYNWNTIAGMYEEFIRRVIRENDNYV